MTPEQFAELMTLLDQVAQAVQFIREGSVMVQWLLVIIAIATVARLFK